MDLKKSDNIIHELSFNFAVRIVKFYQHLTECKKVHVLSKQILRCGTSIGANVRESEHAASTADFVSKLTIALKEADETQYWLELLHETEIINDNEYNSLSNDVKQIIGTLVKIIKTTKASTK